MTISMHSASVPLFNRQLGTMLAMFDKAEAHAVARGFDANAYLAQRLAPDMLPLVAQIRIASDTAKAAVARLAGLEAPKFDDNETTLDELRARIRKTLDYINSVPADAVDGSEGREIVLPMRNRDPLVFTGLVYLQHYVLPNFFFHITTAYALLRNAGVALGKRDYLGAA